MEFKEFKGLKKKKKGLRKKMTKQHERGRERKWLKVGMAIFA